LPKLVITFHKKIHVVNLFILSHIDKSARLKFTYKIIEILKLCFSSVTFCLSLCYIVCIRQPGYPSQAGESQLLITVCRRPFLPQGHCTRCLMVSQILHRKPLCPLRVYRQQETWKRFVPDLPEHRSLINARVMGLTTAMNKPCL